MVERQGLGSKKRSAEKRRPRTTRDSYRGITYTVVKGSNDDRRWHGRIEDTRVRYEIRSDTKKETIEKLQDHIDRFLLHGDNADLAGIAETVVMHIDLRLRQFPMGDGVNLDQLRRAFENNPTSAQRLEMLDRIVAVTRELIRHRSEDDRTRDLKRKLRQRTVERGFSVAEERAAQEKLRDLG